MNAQERLVDIIKPCWPVIYFEPLEIKFILAKNKDDILFVTTVPKDDIKSNVVHTINLFVDVVGECVVSDEDDFLEKKYTLYNWRILPEGILPHEFLERAKNHRKTKATFLQEYRLETLDKYKTEEIGQGINGFYGYFAYVFSKICVFESPIYGNATYIVKKNNWQELSKMTKKELFNDKLVLYKITHNKNWKKN